MVSDTAGSSSLDSNGLDMGGNQEEDVSDSLNTTRTSQDRSQEGPGGGTNVAMPEPSCSHAEHQATGMPQRQGLTWWTLEEVP